MSATYTPTTDSLAGRVCAYFLKHRDEELSAADIALKFDSKMPNVSTLLASAVQHRLLRRENGVYTAGQQIGQLVPPPAAPTAPAVPTFPRPSQRGKRLPAIDVSAIAVEDNVPMPVRTSSVKLAWSSLLDRMKPGQASAPLSHLYKSTAKSAVAARAKDGKPGKFTVAHVSDTQIRIWRTE